MIIQSNVTDRLMYQNAQEAMIKAGISQIAYNNAVKTQSVLRLIQPLVTGSTIFNFPVLNNQTGTGQAQRRDEIRLAQQNAFFAGQWQFVIFKGASATDYAVEPKTYPSSTVFTTGAASLYTLYNGTLQITIDNSVIVPNYEMRKFLTIPQTQATAAVDSPVDEFHGEEMLTVEPNVVFVGTSQPEINIVIPAAMATLDADTYGVLTMYGILAQNVALGAITG